MHLVNYVDEVLEHCDLCRARDKAPHVPIAGTTTAPMSNETLQVDLFSEDIIALRASDAYSK